MARFTNWRFRREASWVGRLRDRKLECRSSVVSLVSSPKLVGSEPTSLLVWMDSCDKSVNEPRFVGSVDVKLLLKRSSDVSRVLSPSCEGIGPRSLLFCICREESKTSFDMVVGMKKAKPFEWRDSIVNCVHDSNTAEGGSVPVSMFAWNHRTESLVSSPRAEGIVAVKEFE